MSSRTIPKKIKNFLEEKYQNKCGFPGCKWPAVALHHVKRFALFKRHRQEEIVPICKIHHELAHAGLIDNEEGEIEKWGIKLTEQKENKEKSLIDKKVRKWQRRMGF